jgi:hypothetical protein
MRSTILALAFTMCSTVSYGQVPFEIGGPYAADRYYTTDAKGWFLTTLAEGASVAIEKGELKMIVIQDHGATFLYAGAGYDAATDTYDRRWGAFVLVNLPVLIPNDVRIRVVTPPNGTAQFTPAK